MTGTLAAAASASTCACAPARIMMALTYRDSTMPVSSIDSPRPSCISDADSTTAPPPSWPMPTSNGTPVRADAPLQHLEGVGESEQLDQLVAVELVDREQVAAGEAGRGGGEHGHGRKSMPQSCMNMQCD